MTRPHLPPNNTEQQGVFEGFVLTTYDALLVLEAAISGLIPRVTRRFTEPEKRNCIRSGFCFVFGEEEADIKRWTDGLQWSPSRIRKNFLIYRERWTSDEQRDDLDSVSEYPSWLAGTLNSGDIKREGLIKKTIGIAVDGKDYHLISYYYAQDVISGRLKRPSELPQFQNLVIRNSIVECRKLREPLKYEVGPNGRLIPIPDDEGDDAPVLTRLPDTPSPVPSDDDSSEENAAVMVSQPSSMADIQPRQFFLAAPQPDSCSPTAQHLAYPLPVFAHDMLSLDSPQSASTFDVPTPPPMPANVALNTLEFYPDGYGNIVPVHPANLHAAATVSRAHSPLVRRRSTRSAVGVHRHAPYARQRNSAPEAGLGPHREHQPTASSSKVRVEDGHDEQQLKQHLAHPVPALIRTRCAPAPLQLISVPNGLYVQAHTPEPLSAASAASFMSEFDSFYGPLTPQSTGGFDYFGAMSASVSADPGLELNGGAGKFVDNASGMNFPDFELPAGNDDMSQYLQFQSVWESSDA